MSYWVPWGSGGAKNACINALVLRSMVKQTFVMVLAPRDFNFCVDFLSTVIYDHQLSHSVLANICT